MTRVLMVCLGNICRSPMAEYLFRAMAQERGIDVQCDSAGTSDEEWGNAVYPPARRKLAEMGIDCSQKRARQMSRQDYDRYDLLIGMEERHLAAMQRICGGDPEGKMHLMLEDAPQRRGIADPWYTGDFDTACDDILEGCRLWLDRIERETARKT